nr:hypothetical protein [uncultured Allobacillus sp.]
MKNMYLGGHFSDHFALRHIEKLKQERQLEQKEKEDREKKNRGKSK